MVAATHWLAAATGMSVLEKGGNAFDAAAAAGFVLQVVEPHLNGPGGEVPVIFYSAAEDRVRVLCGQGTLPAKASVKGLLDLGLSQVPGTGLLPACVPGAFGAWMTLLEAYGTMEVSAVLEPAITYALRGFPLLGRAAALVGRCEETFRCAWPSSAEVYLRGGSPPLPGELFTNPLLANTYWRVAQAASGSQGGREQRIARATDAFYRGFVAEAIDRFVSTSDVQDDSGRAHRGLLSGEDMASWRATFEEAVSLEFANFRVHKTGPWGQGPVFLAQLRILEGLGLAGLDPGGPEWVHLVTESAKLAFADRDAFYGDPDFVEVPLAELLSKEYAAQRQALIADEASLLQRPGTPGGFQPWQPPPELMGEDWGLGAPSALAPGAPPDPTGGSGPGQARSLGPVEGDTCHLDVVDRWGNVVSATPSGGWLHASPCVPGLGFPLTTRGQMCWLDESSPAPFAAGRRPRTTLSPTLALRGRGEALAFGTPGGDQQDQWTLGFFLRHALHGLDLQAAIDFPSFHTSHVISSFHPRRWNPARLHIESRFDASTQHELARRGHDLALEGEWSLGRVCAAARHGSMMAAAADPRQDQAYAVGR